MRNFSVINMCGHMSLKKGGNVINWQIYVYVYLEILLV